MALYLSEDDVGRLLSMRDCIEALQESFRDLAEGRASYRPRARAAVRGGMLHLLGAASERLGRMASKTYATSRAGARFVVLLFDLQGPELLAIIEADRLGQIRTGAATGLATRLLARPRPEVLAILGTGWQARGQALAIAAACPPRALRAYGRDAERLRRFCREMAEATGLPVAAAASAEAAVRGADVVVTATNAAAPVLRGAWLAPGAHLNAVGSNRADRRELDEEAVRRADPIVVDSLEQARLEAGDLLCPPQDPAVLGADGPADPLARAVELSEIVAGRRPGRTTAVQITLFKSLGIGLEDLAAASLVYDLARQAGAGRSLP
jgi:ornithine cyclodeaminase/alanine dehydrogenase-like protein (mu-crystallin family)